MQSVFITGTDTGVGKTLIASCICAYCSLRKGFDVGVMKPFESGLSLHGKDLLPWDAITLKEASGSQDDLALINPYAFEAPLAPEAASEREHVRIDLETVDRIYEKLLKAHDILIIEGAGGILVPIRNNFFFLDLVKRWDVPVLIVSRLGLGTINHTLLTYARCKREGIRVVGVILNNSEGRDDIAAKTNPSILQKYLDDPILGIFPYNEVLSKGKPDREMLARSAEKSINMEPILKLVKKKRPRNSRSIG